MYIQIHKASTKKKTDYIIHHHHWNTNKKKQNISHSTNLLEPSHHQKTIPAFCSFQLVHPSSGVLMRTTGWRPGGAGASAGIFRPQFQPLAPTLPEKVNGWNLKLTKNWKGKFIWTKPPWLCGNLNWSSRVYMILETSTLNFWWGEAALSRIAEGHMLLLRLELRGEK